MKHRRLLLVALALLLLATFFLPPVYWRVVGWVNREAFYDGMPTSWWEGEVERYSPAYVYVSFAVSPPPRYQSGWERKVAPRWFDFLLPRGLGPVAIQGNPPLTDGDAAALPVLLELLQSKDAKVRWVAVWSLGRMGEEAKSALLAVRQMCEDSDDQVRSAAWEAQFEIGGNQIRKSQE